jgi:hypothetical protein
VPEVEPLKNLTAARLAALNHGTIKAPPGVDAARLVPNKVRAWAGRVGEIRVGDGPDPVIAVQIVGVDTEAIVEKARVYDNTGNRIRKIRELLFTSLGVEDRDDLFLVHSFVWRGSRRRCDVLDANVRERPDETPKAQGDDWKVIIDWPFDDPGHDPSEDHVKLDGFLGRHDSFRTLVWLPVFFAVRTEGDLGKLVILDHLLRGDNLDQHAQHLSLQDRLSARLILENQRGAPEGTLKLALGAAYGIAREPHPGMLDATHEPAFRSLDRSFAPQVPVGADLGKALAQQFPDHPHFEREVKKTDCEKVRAEVRKAARAEDGRVPVEKALRPVIKLVVNPLGLGHMGEQYLVLEKAWVTHFNKQLAAEKKTTSTPRELRDWMDRPRAKGLAPEVGNLLILAFAEQTDRSFTRRGLPYAPTPDNLPDELGLRLQTLPPEDQWEQAKGRACEVFGNVWHRDAPVSPAVAASARWRPAEGEARDGEVLLEGTRVRSPGDAPRLIAAWSEETRSGAARDVYHGGASPQEMVTPLVLLADATACRPVPEPCEPRQPTWWEGEGRRSMNPPPPASKPRKPAGSLVPLETTEPEPAAAAAPPPPATSAGAGWLGPLLRSPAYRAQRQMVRKFAPEDEVVAQVLAALDGHGGSMTPAALARKVGWPRDRLDGLVAKLQRLLNVDGYEVLRLGWIGRGTSWNSTSPSCGGSSSWSESGPRRNRSAPVHPGRHHIPPGLRASPGLQDVDGRWRRRGTPRPRRSAGSRSALAHSRSSGFRRIPTSLAPRWPGRSPRISRTARTRIAIVDARLSSEIT